MIRICCALALILTLGAPTLAAPAARPAPHPKAVEAPKPEVKETKKEEHGVHGHPPHCEPKPDKPCPH
jgi:hypothetical protein